MNYFAKKKKKTEDLLDLPETLSLYKTDMENKSKRTLWKIVKKFYEEFINDELLDDIKKKERPLDICNNLKPSSKQPSADDDQKLKVPSKSTMPSPGGSAVRLLMSYSNKFKLMAKVT